MNDVQYKCPMKMNQREDVYCDPECAWCAHVKDRNSETVPVCAVAMIAIGVVYGKDLTLTNLAKEGGSNDSL